MTIDLLKQYLLKNHSKADFTQLLKEEHIKGLQKKKKEELIDFIIGKYDSDEIFKQLLLVRKNKHSYRISYLKSNIVGIISLIIMLIGIYLSIWAVNKNEEFVKNKAAVNKSIPKLYFGPSELTSDSACTIVYGLPENDSSFVITSLPLSLYNGGELDLEDVSLTIRYYELLKIAINNEQIKIVNSLPYEKPPYRNYSKLNPFEYVTYTFEHLRPQSKLKINEPIHLYNTEFTFDSIFSKTNKPLQVVLSVALKLNIILTSKNNQELEYEIKLMAYKSKSLDELTIKYLSAINTNYKSNEKKESFLEKIFSRNNNPLNSVLIVWPNYNEITTYANIKYYIGSEGTIRPALYNLHDKFFIVPDTNKTFRQLFIK